jgi:hypothetical protein
MPIIMNLFIPLAGGESRIVIITKEDAGSRGHVTSSPLKRDNLSPLLK